MAGTISELKDRGKAAVDEGLSLKERFDDTHAGRTLERFNDNRGNVLSGGIAYYSLTSIASGVLLAATVLSVVFLGNEEAIAAVIDTVEQAVPGIITPAGAGPDAPGLITEEQLLSAVGSTTATGVAGLISVGLLLWAASRYVSGLRMASWLMLGESGGSGLVGKLKDLLGVLLIGVLVILGAGLQVATSAVSGSIAAWLGQLLGRDLSTAALAIPGLVVLLLVDTMFVLLVVKYLGQTTVPWRHLLAAALVGALALGLLRQFSSLLVAGASSNALLAPFAAILALLIMMDYSARIILFVSAWLGTYRGHGQLALEDVDERFIAWVERAGGTVAVDRLTRELMVSVNGGALIYLIDSTREGVRVRLRPPVGDTWIVMRGRSLELAERFLAYATARFVRSAEEIPGPVPVHRGSTPYLPGLAVEAIESDLPFAITRGETRLATFAQASDAEAAARFLTAPLHEIAESLASEDGSPLFDELTGNVGLAERARDQVRERLGRLLSRD